MNRPVCQTFVAVLCIVASTVVSYAADKCAEDDLAIKACVKQDLIDSNILIKGVLADPGGLKTKSATSSCRYHCNAHSTDFEAKWSKFRNSQDD